MSDIWVIYGDNPTEMVKEVLKHTGIEAEIRNKGALIGLKPNLVVSKPSSSGATTSPGLVSGVIEYLKERGFNNIRIMESSWLGDSTQNAFRACGYNYISKYYNVPLVDLKKDTCTSVTIEGLNLNICNEPLNVDYLINMPVLKAHCQTYLTCALKNLKGCIPDSEKRRYHQLGLHKPIAYLNKALKSHMVIVDGLMGDLTYEEGGNPVRMDRVIAGRDSVLIDSYAAELLGYAPEEIDYIRISHSLGLGSMELEKARIIEYGQDKKPKERVRASNKARKLSRYIEEKDACSACYGSLIHALERLDEKGRLRKLNGKLYLGQGFKDLCLDEIGIGSCTRNFKTNIKGCPPKARDIIKHFE